MALKTFQEVSLNDVTAETVINASYLRDQSEVECLVTEKKGLKKDTDVLWHKIEKRNSFEETNANTDNEEVNCGDGSSDQVTSKCLSFFSVSRKERSREVKREQRANPIFRERENLKSKIRMKERRLDAAYREAERQRDRERRRKARRKVNGLQNIFESDSTPFPQDDK